MSLKIVFTAPTGDRLDYYTVHADRIGIVVNLDEKNRAYYSIRVASFAAATGDAKKLKRLLRHPVQDLSAFLYGATPNPLPLSLEPFDIRTRALSNATHMILRSAPSTTDKFDVAFTMIVPDGTRPVDAFYQAVNEAQSIPILKSWAPYIFDYLNNKHQIHGFRPVSNIRGFDVITRTEEIAQAIEEGFRLGKLQIPMGNVAAPNVDLHTVHTLDGYMLTFGKTLGERVLEETPARHLPGTVSQPKEILRTLYPAQLDVAAATAKTWETEKTAWIIGEQGVGKTTIAAAAAQIRLKGKGRILVHCPNHLTEKWERELKATLGAIPVHVVRTWKEALRALPSVRNRSGGLEAWILPRDSAKLGYLFRPAAIAHVRADGGFQHWTCPSCGQVLKQVYKDKKPRTWDEKAFRSRSASNAHCPVCRSSLWQADSHGPKREAPSRIFRRRLRPGTFDVLIADEIHEEKGNTAQGQSLTRLYGLAKKACFLTGTLLGGKASDLYYHLYRTQPATCRALGYEYQNPMPFVKTYGVVERRDKRYWDGNRSSTSSEQPGVHPAVYGDWLMGSATFVGLDDLNAHLPSYEEEVVLVPMHEQQERLVAQVYQALKERLAVALHSGSKAVLGSFLQVALAYPDHVFANTPITGADGSIIVQPSGTWNPKDLLPKEAQIAAYVLKEQMRGRRCLIFAQYTQKYDVTDRLREQLDALGLSVKVLTTAVKPEDRERWLAQAVADGVDVVLCHSRLVATGLDLLDFPTILFAQTGYSLFDIRQASRRSWRIGQTQPVKVAFFAYAETLQETALRALAEKLLAAQAVEGRFSAEGLQALSSGSNAALQLANALAFGLEGLPEIRDAWTVAQAEGTSEPPVLELPPEPRKESGPAQTLKLIPVRRARVASAGYQQIALF